MTSNGHLTDTVPSITITDATPQKTLESFPDFGTSHTPSFTKTTDTSYRLLYRGALSLPDSYLVLDGLAFSARLPGRLIAQDSPRSPSQSRRGAEMLMFNPLALALESMRGRQTLRFKGAVRLRDVWMDDTGEVFMDIHPSATLSKVYFENVLCLVPLEVHPRDTSGVKRTEVGVRVSLGDTDGPETTEIVIYGETSSSLHPPPFQLSPAATSTSAVPPLSVRVARITPAPPAPRPDDPTPRKPPAHLFGGTSVSELGANKRIVSRHTVRQDKGKSKGKDKAEDSVLRRAREVMLHLPRSKVSTNGSVKFKDKAREQDRSVDVFKVPELPVKARRKQGQRDVGTDVFGTVGPPQLPSPGGKGKGKASTEEGKEGETDNAIEAANKLMLKKMAVRQLAVVGVPRSHAEFKDVFGFVYRGAGFALRSQLKTMLTSSQVAEAVVEAHVKMYVPTPDPHDTSGQ